MTYDEFVTKTNIKEIIKNAHRGASNVTEEDRLRFYYDFRMHTTNWHRNAIRNLKYIECECKRNSNKMHRSPPNTSTENHSERSASNANHSQLSKASSGRQIDYAPSEFQKEIISMDFNTFVHETNAAELVEQEYNKQFNGTKEFTQVMLDSGLKQFFKFKNRLRKQYVNVLRNLKYKVCDCRRNKTFVDASIQTDQPMAYDVAVQCGNEETVQLKLASLSIHRNIDTIEIVASESSEVSSTQDMDQTTQGETLSAENVTAFGQEVHSSIPETSTTSNQVTTISHQQRHTSSQDHPPLQSQPIFSSDQVQLTELMLSSPVQQIARTNPIETVAENVIGKI